VKTPRTLWAAALAACLSITVLTTQPALAASTNPSSASPSSASPSSASATPAAAPALVSDPTALVNPFIGTGSGGAEVGSVDMFPGASAPFGMVAWSPDTPSSPSSGGYSYSDSAITGFSVTHASGAGCDIAGDLPILPVTGDVGTNPTADTQPFSHSTETAHPGSYSVTVGSGSSAIGVSLAATTRTGIGDFTYPATTSADMLFKVGDSQATVSASEVSIVGNDEVTGSVSAGKFCDMPNSYKLYSRPSSTAPSPATAPGTARPSRPAPPPRPRRPRAPARTSASIRLPTPRSA